MPSGNEHRLSLNKSLGLAAECNLQLDSYSPSSGLT